MPDLGCQEMSFNRVVVQPPAELLVSERNSLLNFMQTATSICAEAPDIASSPMMGSRSDPQSEPLNGTGPGPSMRAADDAKAAGVVLWTQSGKILVALALHHQRSAVTRVPQIACWQPRRRRRSGWWCVWTDALIAIPAASAKRHAVAHKAACVEVDCWRRVGELDHAARGVAH